MQKFVTKAASGVRVAREASRRFRSDESGATSIEYAMIAGLISVAIAATLLAIGTTLRDDFFGAVLAGFS
ncbi:Flp family type IVb pilin [Roseibium sp.]|uniref:Flp family type IVb pilin n=1 Tax=Roseibium sp. TaxID=1936156 RepID=UPI003A976F27